MTWRGALGRFGPIGAWSVLAAGLILRILQWRRLRRRVDDVSSKLAAGKPSAEAVPETRFEDRDEAHRGGARYD